MDNTEEFRKEKLWQREHLKRTEAGKAAELIEAEVDVKPLPKQAEEENKKV